MKLKFKTNINCGNCIRSVSGFLNEIENISWEVDTTTPDKILTVEGENLNKKEIVDAVENAGFDIDELKN
jgi:copper chaperone CopZ